jgi:hypothetical protein
MSAAFRPSASLFVQPAATNAIALASQMVGHLSRFSIFGVLIECSHEPTVLAFLKTAPEIVRRLDEIAGFISN